MKKFLQIFKKAWFWWLFGLIALTAIVWFVLPLIKFGSVVPFASAAVRLLIILILVIVWAVINIRLAKKKKEENEEEGYKDDPEVIKQALALLKVNFGKAMDLVRSGLWWQKLLRRDIYQVPWYLVLGAPGSGRSNLLRQSGLSYPVANESYQSFAQEGDELCQWWFSKEAVLIDTHANLVTELDEESLANRVWMTLLNVLKRNRPSQPLNGVLLTIDINELLSQNKAQRTTYAHTLRTQLQVLNRELGIQCPVYVCFTKCDLLAGFNEVFTTLNESDRQQLLGFTFDYDANKDAIVQFDKLFSQLISRVNHLAQHNLHLSADSKKNALISNFVMQLSAIKTTLDNFLKNIFESNHFQQRMALRSVCFTSAKQQGTAVNYLAAQAKNSFGIEVVSQDEAEGDVAYFINKVLTNVMLPEKGLLLFNALQKQRQTLMLRLAYGVVALIVLIMLYFWGSSFVQNKERLNYVQDAVQTFKAVPANTAGKSSLMYVLPMLNELREMRAAYFPEEDPQSVHWGLYQGNKVDSVAEEIYRQNLMIYFMPYVLNVVTGELDNPKAKPNQTYNALRVYLMLANPSKMSKDFMRNWLTAYWQRMYKDKPDLVSSLAENFAALLDMKLKPITLNEPLVTQARVKLQHTSQAQRDYFELQELAEIAQLAQLHVSNGLNLDFNQVFGEKAMQLTVPALYTFNGFEDLYQEQLQKVLENEGFSAWVLGDYASKSINDESNTQDIAQQVQAFYMRDYIAHWNKIISGLKIQPFANLKQAGNVVGIMAGASSPLYEVLQTIRANTILHPEASPAAASGGAGLGDVQKHMKANKALTKAVMPKKLKAITGKAKRFKPKYKKGKGGGSAAAVTDQTVKTPVGVTFSSLNDLQAGNDEAGSPFDTVMENISKLNEYLMALNTSSNPDEAAYKQVVARLSGESAESPLNALTEQAKTLPKPVQGWVNSIVQYTWQAMLLSARNYIDSQYKKDILPVYNETMLNKYPFYKQAKQSTSLTEFTSFFAPEGQFDTFFTKYLAQFIDATNTWKLKEVEGASLPLSKTVVSELQRLDKIKQTFFQEAGQPAKVSYSLTVLNLSAQLKSAALNLNNQAMIYRHGPKRAVTFTWPGANNNQDTLSLTNLSDQLKRFTDTGLWAAFRVFDQGGLSSRAGSTTLTASFSMSGKGVSYALQSEAIYNPFSPDMLHAVRLPTSLGDT